MRGTAARIYGEAWKGDWSGAQKNLVMGDGAEWIWNLAAEHFPGSIQIVDLYHARQRLWEVARWLRPNDLRLMRAGRNNVLLHRNLAWPQSLDLGAKAILWRTRLP